MSLNFGLNKRAFVFTLDALVAAGIVLAMTASLSLLSGGEPSLNRELLFQQAQDILEVCSKISNLTNACFSFLTESNPSLKYAFFENSIQKFGSSPADFNEVVIERQYGITKFRLVVWTR